jgi:hypothetical protein
VSCFLFCCDASIEAVWEAVEIDSVKYRDIRRRRWRRRFGVGGVEVVEAEIRKHEA